MKSDNVGEGAMYRRVVSLILVPCLLLTQSASLGHAHIGQPAGAAARPHVHVPAVLSHHHHHAHSHAVTGSHRHHHHGVGSGLPAAAPVSLAPVPNHDRDAVYVAVDVIAAERAQGVECTDCHWLMPSPDATLGGRLGPQGGIRLGLPPPPSPAVDCPLYVRHLALLI